MLVTKLPYGKMEPVGSKVEGLRTQLLHYVPLQKQNKRELIIVLPIFMLVV
jgi:hypothetical protein